LVIEIVGVVIVCLVIYAFLNQNGFPVFLFHKIDDKSDTSPEVFEEVLKYIHQKKLNTLKACELENIKKVDKNSIMITFDDGYKNNYDVVFPLLKKYQCKMTLFINSQYILHTEEEREKDEMHQNYPFLLWAEIEEMHRSGLVDIQLHTGKHYFQFVPSKARELFTKEDNLQDMKNYQELYGYSENLEGLPIFRKRGAISEPAYILDSEKLLRLKEKIASYSDIQEANKAIAYEEYGHIETAEEFQVRVRNVIYEDQKNIKENMGYHSNHFAWPWGHYTKLAVNCMQNIGIQGLYTCIKGPNSRTLDMKCIRRDSFRKCSLSRFKWKFYLCRNTIVGKIYEWVS